MRAADAATALGHWIFEIGRSYLSSFVGSSFDDCLGKLLAFLFPKPISYTRIFDALSQGFESPNPIRNNVRQTSYIVFVWDRRPVFKKKCVSRKMITYKYQRF